MANDVECVCAVGAQLGEGPVWSASERALWFVDVKGQYIHRFEAGSATLHSWRTPATVGFAIPASHSRFICGLQLGLHTFHPDTGAFALVTRVDSDQPHNRLNDACADAHGRLWFGTMDDREQQATGRLYRFDARGLSRQHDGYVITNGPTISPDGRTLYHVDTRQRLIYAFDLHDDGSLANRRVFVRVEQPGHPDGPTVDTQGCLWVAMFNGWSVNRYSPRGELIDRIPMPVANCTKPAFGGADLRTLYITTARKGLSAQQRAEQPLAGHLFAVRVCVPGLPSNTVRYDG